MMVTNRTFYLQIKITYYIITSGMSSIDTKSAIILFISVILGLIIGSCVSFFRYPQQEFLICNSSYICSKENKYFGIIKTKRNYKISSNVLYNEIIKNHIKIKSLRRGTTSDGIEYHHNLSDGKKINIKFKNYIHILNEKQILQIKSNEMEKFEKYKENPNDFNYKIINNINIDDRMNDIFAMSFIFSGILLILIIPIAYLKD